MDKVECPYCGKMQEINHDDGYGYCEDETYQQECGDCGKTFCYTTSICYYYESNKADCLNGGEHNLEKVHGCPPELLKNIYRCADCGEEIDTDPEDSAKVRKEFFDNLK